ncbi:class I SAM-dependent methyltransferase [Sphingomonas bacterium]|uniref:class I SAM-dependent methyltransferase n=1 Tax=Sphingomonas bacterium TaxID=1895847 RepID=UPI001576461D|nr:SAM-dependent methyltransferase [Sphingomonas bacterium]
MALANAHYYATRDPIGQQGDFITAPEISQMFGEIVGLALADTWRRAGCPACAFVELGPGRGTLAGDALRAMKIAGLEPPVHFVETSPLLRDRQRDAVPQATWHETIETLPEDVPLLIVANEFFDALPLRQFIRTFSGWRERMVSDGPEGFAPTPGTAAMDRQIPRHLVDGDPGGIVERNPTSAAIVKALAQRLARQGGAMLAIDYGHHGREAGDTLQALHAHAYADPFARPGASDLSAHVDFSALAAAARKGGARVAGPVEQGQWLIALGISDRAAALSRGAPEREHEIAAAYRRLTDAEAMGELFKVLAIHAPGWPKPAGMAR